MFDQFGANASEEYIKRYERSENWNEARFMNLKKTGMDIQIKDIPKLLYQQFFEKNGRHNDQYIGRSIYNQSVFINNKEDLIGKNKNILIIRSTDFALEGKLSEQ